MQERSGNFDAPGLASGSVRSRLCVPAVVAAAAAVASCGGKGPPPVAAAMGAVPPNPSVAVGAPPPSPSVAMGAPPPNPPGEGSAPVLVHRVTPSHLFPELVGTRGYVANEDGAERVLVDRMRLLVHPGGAVERADELFPGGNVLSVALPSRLGGGYLFHVNAGGGTEIWRAASWLDKLHPLTRRNEVVSDIVAGFDRLYLRLPTGNRVLALDARTGEPMGLGPLPISSSYGMLAFADGWRAVVDADLRGPLITFDAGANWRAVGLAERTLGVGVVDGNPAVLVPSGRYLVDPRGTVTFRTDAPSPHVEPDPDPHPGDDPGADARHPSPLGKRPLRAAVEDGWPDSLTTAVVARGGALARVSLLDGTVLALVEDAYPERRSTCHAVRLGLHGVGFLCGEHEGPTTLYEYVPGPGGATGALAMRLVLRYEKPRFASASGNGAIVLRGRCADGASPTDEDDSRWYCVRSPQGEMREIRVKGFDLGIERVVGLGDGRVAVVVPPRGASAGALSVISGGAAVTVPLDLPEAAARTLKQGMWLDGLEERSPGVLGGWVEAGGPFLGVQITLDGKVKAGDLRDDPGGAIYGGRFAVALSESGRAFETSDFGMTWAPFELPDRDDEARAAPSRACGPVGCALPGWVRVGWGEPRTPDDMKVIEAPTSPYVPIKVSPTLNFDCSVATVATPPLPDKPSPALARAPAPRGPRPGTSAGPAAAHVAQHETPWIAFRNVEAPPLGADDYGADNGNPTNEAALLRAYAWGKAGADWTRNGRWLVRFDDRFEPLGGVRTSALTTSLWPHQAEALDAIGTHASYGTSTWSSQLDPSGRAVLASACRGGTSCTLYSIAEGQPILPLRGPVGGFPRPLPESGVRVGETWFFLAPAADAIVLWRADLGVARQVSTFHRRYQYGRDQPRLVRRAQGSGIGMLIGGAAEPGERSGSWYVLPVDPETGSIGEAVALARRDLAGTALPRCASEQDGWLVDLAPSPDATTNVEVDNARVSIDAVEMRVRLDPGRACVESLASKSGYLYPLEKAGASSGPLKPLTAPPGHDGGGPHTPGKKAGGEEGSLPLAVTEKATGRRWGLSCRLRKR